MRPAAHRAFRIVASLATASFCWTATAADKVEGPATTVILVGPKEDAALVLDSPVKEVLAKAGDLTCSVRFAVTNTSSVEVIINQVRTSCGCMISKLPAQPWKLAPGATGELQLDVDLRGKSGVLVKTATIDTPTTFKVLTLKVTIPPSPAVLPQERERNMQLATADRQAVFKGECATCHARPAAGQFGAALYVAVCSICHDAEHRASMVPDLHTLPQPPDATFWRTIITQGKPGTLMPAFDQQAGGPLTTAQIDSLVRYLTTEFRQLRAVKPPQPPGEAP